MGGATTVVQSGPGTRNKMRYVWAEIPILLTIIMVWSPLYANNMTSDNIEEHNSTLGVNGSTETSYHHRLIKRCWDLVIPGRPTLAKVIVTGSCLIGIALTAGLSLFFYIYCRHKDRLEEIEEDLFMGKRCFKPQLEDLELGLSEVHVAKPVSFMKKVISHKIRRRKEHEEDEQSGEDEMEDDSQNESENKEKLNTPSPRGLTSTMLRKKREQIRDEEEEPAEESQLHDGDPRKTTIKDKAKGAEGKERKTKELKTEKGESSEESDPKKKKKPWQKLTFKKKGKSEAPDHKKKEATKKPKDVKKTAGRFLKGLRKKPEGKAKKEKKEKGAKKPEKVKAKKVKVKKPEVTKKVKKVKIKIPKPTKTKKPKKEKSPKKPKKK
ncbi:uncharacterized protein [Engystomops pustulosus]|uniref:uncharacterized protein n=1 Tax=Engystomops pustulosus TaxID=76066 RepID=UPI003AFA2532